MNKKLENTFANRGYLHRSIIGLKKDNEARIEVRKKIDAEQFEDEISEIIRTNWRLNLAIKIEMGVL